MRKPLISFAEFGASMEKGRMPKHVIFRKIENVVDVTTYLMGTENTGSVLLQKARQSFKSYGTNGPQ